MKDTIAVLILLASFAISASSAKKPKEPSQPDIVKDCLSVTDIHAHPYGAFSGVTVPEGLDAIVRNTCKTAVMVSLSIGYFDKNGNQFGSGNEVPTVGAGANFQVRHVAVMDWITKARLKSVTLPP